MKKVGVVILNYKVKDYAVRCLKSVINSSYKNLKIYLVDNNSEDGIESELDKYNKVIFIQTGANLGYTGGNNIGIKTALSESCDYVFILNPDTEVAKDTIEILMTKADEYQAGIVTPKIYYGQTNIIWYAGKKLDLDNVLGVHIGVDQQDQGQFDQDRETDDITGAAMFIGKEVFEKVGLLDEKYFLYYEESDFAYRAKKMGFKLMYIYSARVYHDNAKATGLGSPLQDYFITRNRMLFASKFLSLRTQFALFREAMRNFKNKTRRQALVDFLTGNFGKGSFLK